MKNETKKVIILGAGLVGGPMALDLASDQQFRVTVADRDGDVLEALEEKSRSMNPGMTGDTAPYTPLQTLCCDLSAPADVSRLVSNYDLVINAVPGFMGYRTLKAIIEAGRNVVDIAFFIEDPFELDELARARNVTAIMDMGVAPGMCNVLIGYADHLLEHTDEVLYMVGGLPVVREWPWEYKAVFSPIDVIEEYTRPARFIENGNLVVRPALSDPELLNFPGVGTLEAFNTDGLRSLARTIRCPNMKEKTLRYPGHIEKMRVLRDTGYFSQEKIEIGGTSVSPMEMTAKLLFPKWKLKEGEADLTVMTVQVKGRRDGKQVKYAWNLLDYHNPVTGIHSMARTTGYAATVALRMVASGIYDHKGVSVPEFVGKKPECVKFLLDGLKERGVVYVGGEVE